MRVLLVSLLTVGAAFNTPAWVPPSQEQPLVQAHIGKGYELVKDERFAEAAAEFEAALARSPQLTRVRYQLGVCYFALGRNGEARREFERLRVETHDDPSVIYFMGRLDLREHNFDAAVREFQRIAAQPPFPDTAYYLGSAYLEKDNLAAAEEWLKKARLLNPRDFRVPDHLARLYRREGRASEAERQYASSAELRQRYNKAAEAGVECSQSLEEREPEEAREACAKLLQLDDPDRLTLLGMIYGEHSRYADAIEPLRRAAELDPDSYEIQHNLGLTYFRLKHYADAREPLEHAVALRPDFFGSNALLGATLFALAQDLEAYSALDHAHQLNPQDPDTTDLLFKSASILGTKSYGEKRYSEALGYLRTAENLKPQDPQVHARLARVYALLGNARQAELEKNAAEQLGARR